MTIYAGEKLILTHTAELDGTPLTAADVEAVYAEVFNKATESIEYGQMVWSSTNERWEYEWWTIVDTFTPAATPLPAGTYRARMTILGLDGSTNSEIKRIRLHASRLPVRDIPTLDGGTAGGTGNELDGGDA